MGSDWFPRETRPLLAALCSVTVQWGDVTEALAEFGPGVPKEPERFESYRELTKMRSSLNAQLASLGTKLRLTLSSRNDRRSATTEARRGEAARPWDDSDLAGQDDRDGGQRSH